MQSLDLAFGALSDPTRRAIVQRLTAGPVRVTDLAAPFPMSLNAVSKHVKVLERAGLVIRVKEGREHQLVLNPDPIRAVSAWAGGFETFWNDRLDNLERFLEAEAPQPNRRKP